jgi:hypothetical protein
MSPMPASELHTAWPVESVLAAAVVIFTLLLFLLKLKKTAISKNNHTFNPTI